MNGVHEMHLAHDWQVIYGSVGVFVRVLKEILRKSVKFLNRVWLRFQPRFDSRRLANFLSKVVQKFARSRGKRVNRRNVSVQKPNQDCTLNLPSSRCLARNSRELFESIWLWRWFPFEQPLNNIVPANVVRVAQCG